VSSVAGNHQSSVRAVAWAEIVLSLVPATIIWAMFTPAMVIMGSKELQRASSPVSAKLFLPLILFGGLAGLSALWFLVLPVALGKRRVSRCGAWSVLGLALGLVGAGTFLARMVSDPKFPSQGAGLWFLAYVAVSAIVVACHRLLERAQSGDASTCAS